MYANDNWLSERYYNTIAKISDQGNGQSLVDCPQKVFWFDHISDDLYSDKDKLPTSADGIIINDQMICFIEFKTGFKKKITKQNFDAEEGKCKHIGKVCPEYWDIFFKNQKKETKQLISSIRDKAIESYITLEKKLFPKCDEDLSGVQNRRLIFVAVIDENEIDNMEATLGDLCSKDPSENNCFGSIHNSLKRFTNQKDATDKDYYYDEIRVMSSSDFISFINTCNLST